MFFYNIKIEFYFDRRIHELIILIYLKNKTAGMVLQVIIRPYMVEKMSPKRTDYGMSIHLFGYG